MKKRLISFLLALSMMLSLVPVGAFAASVRNLEISETTHRPTDSGGGNSGWSYDENTDTLTIEDGYIMADYVSYPYIACKVVNRGTIKGAIYTNTVTSENGSFLFGIYKSKPTGTFASRSKEFHTISSSDGTAFGLNSKLYNITKAYSVKEQAVTVNAPEGKVVSEIKGASSGWGGVSGIDTDTAKFTMAEQDVTITFANKSGYTEPTTKIPLVIEDNGYPKNTENGTKDVYNGDGWSFQTTTLANGNNEKALMLDKEFDLTGKVINVPVVVNGVSIEGGTYNKHVETRGQKWITNATFNSTLVNSADVVPGSLSFDSAIADCYHLNNCTFSGAVTNNGCITNSTFKGLVTNNNWIEFSLFKTSEVTSDLTTSMTFRFCVFTKAVTDFPKCVLGSTNGGQLFLSAAKPTFVDSSVEVYHIDATNVAQPSVLGTNAYTAPLVQLEASQAWATAGTEVAVKPASGYTVDNINGIALKDYDRFAIDSPTETGFYRFTPHSDVVLNQSGLGLTFEAYHDYLYPKGTEHGQYAIINGNGWKYENKTLTITDPSITLAETGTFPASYCISTSGAITSGTFKGSVTTTGDVRGGLFLGDFTSANAPTGGIFAKRNNTALNLRKVSIQGGSTFTIPVNGVDHEFAEVYIPDETTITLNAPIALARMNGVDIPATQLSNDGKTVTITANGADIVLDKALTAVDSNKFNVELADGKSYTYGDTVADSDFTITPNVSGVGSASIAGYYKVTNDTADTSKLLTAAEVKDAGTYQVVLKVEASSTYGANDRLTGSRWQFNVAKKAITAADFTFSAPDSLTYDGTAKTATVTQTNEVADNIIIQYTNAAGEVVTAPTNAGTYNVMLVITPDSNHKLEGTSTLGSDDWTFKIAKAELTADMFERTTDTNDDPTMTLKAEYANCGVGTYTVCSELISTITYSMPVNAGTYQFYINAAEGANYKGNSHLTDNDNDDWYFVVDQREPTANLFTIPTPNVTYDGNPHAAAVRAKTAAELTDVPAGPITADFTVKYRLVGGSSAFTTTEPANAGTYEVAVSFPANGNYEGAEDLVLGQFTIGKKTITAEDFTFSAPANLTYDGTAKTATVTQANEVADSIIIQYTNAAGEVVTAPTNAGIYKVVLDITPDSNHKLEGTSTLGSDDWTFEIAKAELTADDFEMVGEGENRTIQPKAGHKGVTVDEVTWMPVESIATLSLDLDEMDSGTYQAYITVSAEENSNYKAPAGQLTDGSWTFSIGKRDLTAADFTIIKPTYPDDRFDGSPKEVQPTYNGAVAIGEITVTYWKQNDASEWVAIEGAPVETGTYRFTLDVAGSPNNNPATGLRGDDWQFTIAEPLYHVYVEGGRAYYFDATTAKITIDNDTLVPAKVTVHLVADTDETADTDTEIALLTLDAEDEGTVDDFQWYIDPRTGSNLTEIANPTSRTDASFVMPRGDVYITTTNPNPEPEIVDSGAGTAVAVVLGGAAIGGVAYLAGTQLYLESVLPKGAAIPVNRQQLADLLWTAAGKPQPQNSVLFTDISAEAIDSQKAARWCVEQGLMQADGASFKPSRHTFRLQVIKAWNDLQAMQKAG